MKLSTRFLLLLSVVFIYGCSHYGSDFSNVPVGQNEVAGISSKSEFNRYRDNPTQAVRFSPVSTFSIDVDTGAYSQIRRMLNAGQLPPQDVVRAEELINYFSYDYEGPYDRNTPFSVIKEIAPSPWNDRNHLLHIGIQGYDVDKDHLPASNLVFLIDVSGSMQSADKLGLLKTSLKLLTQQLTASDRVSIVTYAGASGVALDTTPGHNKYKIISAIDRLNAGGGTNGSAGIEQAYRLAEEAFIEGGINRVILATDGDFNIGIVNHDDLKRLIERKRKNGIALSTLGFGTGNYNDHLMEQLADVGNGNYSYIDTLSEAQKVLIDEISSTMLTIAKDVKIQIEFNPDIVSEYRLIGYENRILAREDFNNDDVDAGDIGAGHSVTALYEITLNENTRYNVDSLRYQNDERIHRNNSRYESNDEIAFLKLRYKYPDASRSELKQWPIYKRDITNNIQHTSDSFRFSAAVAAFAQQLRGNRNIGHFDYADIKRLAEDARGNDPFGYRGEFISLINLAKSLSHY
jgi:Ca-activated chloride channel homolog